MKRIYLLAVLLLLASCAQYRYVAEDAPAVEDVTLIMPYSRVFYIDQEGEHYDEAGSDEQQKLLTGLLLSSGLGITDTVDVVGLPNQKDLDWEIESLPRINHKRMGEIVFEGALDKFLESKGARYGLIVFSEGFIKDRKLYKKEVAKAVLVGVAVGVIGGLAGGAIGGVFVDPDFSMSYEATPGWAYGSSLNAMLVDTQTGQVLFYNKILPVERNPLKPEALASQLQKLFRKYPR
jgi:hypothetical protein